MSDKKCHHGNLRNTFIKTGIKSSAHQERKSVSRQLRIKLQKRKAAYRCDRCKAVCF